MACKHTQELALDKCTISIHPKLELKYKILAKTGYKLTPAKAIEAICEEVVKDVRLTKSDLDAIQSEMKANYDQRMKNRIKVAAHNRGLSEDAFIKKGK